MVGDYQVKQEVIDLAIKKLGLHVWLDAFASRTNKRLTKYCSLLLDQGAYKVIAFSLNWERLTPYLHSPVKLILKVLAKVERDKAEAIIVLPAWRAQMWSQLLQEMIVQQVDLGDSSVCLERSHQIVELQQQVPPGNMNAVYLIGSQKEKHFSNVRKKRLNQMMEP
ncbi:MAG: hypothetical protein EZS28_046867 [Streblomastix strix]|uniref:Uncharacterized protein n=1 Tax=Streblomastix strix TaxID=222440 RepID=A0A5J4THC1_9EUKA|nr:MAG: hypothetical protein EZS28_046867 [Streblomastix strix]